MAANDYLDQMDDEEFEIYQELSKDLIQAKELFTRGDYLIALNLASNVAQRAGIENINKIEASAEGLIGDVKNTIQQKTDESLRIIDEALKQDDPEKARDVYTQAIQLDPENIALKTIEREIERKFEENDQKRKFRALETRLINRKDFGELRAAIHDAESMNPDETFSPELLRIYKESNTIYAEMAKEFSTTTTTLDKGELIEAGARTRCPCSPCSPSSSSSRP